MQRRTDVSTVQGKRGAALVRDLARLPAILATALAVAGCQTPIPRTGAPASTDSVACIAWELDAKVRVSCAGRAGRSVVAGGHWVDDSTGREGFYRVFLTEEPTRVKGYKKDAPQERPYVYVQWLRPNE